MGLEFEIIRQDHGRTTSFTMSVNQQYCLMDHPDDFVDVGHNALDAHRRLNPSRLGDPNRLQEMDGPDPVCLETNGARQMLGAT